MSDQVHVKLSGPAIERLDEWKAERVAVNEKRLEFQDEMETPGLWMTRNGKYVSGWIGELEDHLKLERTITHDGERVKVVSPNRSYNKGKAIAKRLKTLSMPGVDPLYDDLGIPHHYIRGNRMMVPGLEEVDGDWYVVGIDPDELVVKRLHEGCEVVKNWEFLKLKDELTS
jgi:hypothetical protein